MLPGLKLFVLPNEVQIKFELQQWIRGMMPQPPVCLSLEDKADVSKMLSIKSSISKTPHYLFGWALL